VIAAEDRVDCRAAGDQFAAARARQRRGEVALGLGQCGESSFELVVGQLDDRGATVRRRELFTSWRQARSPWRSSGA
jgi:hypothetical protein